MLTVSPIVNGNSSDRLGVKVQVTTIVLGNGFPSRPFVGSSVLSTAASVPFAVEEVVVESCFPSSSADPLVLVLLNDGRRDRCRGSAGTGGITGFGSPGDAGVHPCWESRVDERNRDETRGEGTVLCPLLEAVRR